MFKDWNEHTALVKKSFGEMGKKHPKMLQAYGALEQAAAAEALDAKTRELIAIAVAVTTRCESKQRGQDLFFHDISFCLTVRRSGFVKLCFGFAETLLPLETLF